MILQNNFIMMIIYRLVHANVCNIYYFMKEMDSKIVDKAIV